VIALYHYTLRTRRDTPDNREFATPELKHAIDNAAPPAKPLGPEPAEASALSLARYADPYPDAVVVAGLVIEQLQRQFPTLSSKALEQLVNTQLKAVYPDLPATVHTQDRATVLAPLLMEQIEKEAAKAKAAGKVDNDGYGIVADLSATDAKRIVHEVVAKYKQQRPMSEKLPPGHRAAFYKYREISDEANAWDEDWEKKVTYVLDCLSALGPDSRTKKFEQLPRQDQLEEGEIRRQLFQELVQLHEAWEEERARRAQKNHELALATQDPKDYIIRRFVSMPRPFLTPEDAKPDTRSWWQRAMPDELHAIYKASQQPVLSMDEQLADLAKRVEETSKPTMSKREIHDAAEKLADGFLTGKTIRYGAPLRVKLMGPERQKIVSLINY